MPIQDKTYKNYIMLICVYKHIYRTHIFLKTLLPSVLHPAIEKSLHFLLKFTKSHTILFEMTSAIVMRKHNRFPDCLNGHV